MDTKKLKKFLAENGIRPDSEGMIPAKDAKKANDLTIEFWATEVKNAIKELGYSSTGGKKLTDKVNAHVDINRTFTDVIMKTTTKRFKNFQIEELIDYLKDVEAKAKNGGYDRLLEVRDIITDIMRMEQFDNRNLFTYLDIKVNEKSGTISVRYYPGYSYGRTVTAIRIDITEEDSVIRQQMMDFIRDSEASHEIKT